MTAPNPHAQDCNAPGDPIKHVVVLILENHSFDQMLGCFKAVYPKLEGIDPANPGVNLDAQGAAFVQKPTIERQMTLDPAHDVDNVAAQLKNNNGGFVADFERCFPNATAEQKQFVMGYYPLDFLPALHALAREFTICDHWYSSLPGPTWPNRFFALTGTSNGRVNMPQDGKHGLDLPGWFEQDQTTLFDRLSERGVHWKVYFHDIPQTWVLSHQRRIENIARYFYIQQFHQDAAGAAEDFPAFCLIEPDYMGSQENDDHPPHDIMKAQRLIADVYNALRANEALWNSTLLVVFYDEHGGFYDHVKPPAAVVPDRHQEEYTFDQFGVRVPALMISPWVRRGVVSTPFDHTSVLRYLINKWTLGPLGDRAKAAGDLSEAIDSAGPPRTDLLPHIALSAEQLNPPDADREEGAERQITDHHLSLKLITRYITIDVVEGLPRVVTWLARAIEWLRACCDRALGRVYREDRSVEISQIRPDRVSRDGVATRDRVAAFIKHQKQKAVKVLAAKTRDTRLGDVERMHALRALGSLTGRHFHREPDPLGSVDGWLKQRGH
jgi:phospholipase C